MVTGSVLDLHPSDRVCRPFPGERERRAATRLFTLNGLRPRAKLLIVTHAGSPARTRVWLRSVVPGFEEAAGRIETSVGSRPDRGGRASAGERAGFQGYPGLYALLDVSWGVRDPPGQAAVNALYGRFRVAAVRQYDRAPFPREALDRAAAVHPVRLGQALLRYVSTSSPPGLRLRGDVDLTNRQALASIPAPPREEPDDVVIDADGLGFVDAGSAQLLVATAPAREPRRTVVTCGGPPARLLYLLKAGDALSINQTGEA